MSSPLITISSDISEERVGFVVSRVILFGTIPTEVPIVPNMPTNLPTTPELPAVSPFLCLDDSVSEPDDELPEGHVSHGSFSAMVSRWKIPVAPILPAPSTKIATAPPVCESLTLVITALSAIHSRIRKSARKCTLGLQPVMKPTRSADLRRARRIALSPETSSSSSSSDSASHISEGSFTASLQGTQISPKDHLHHSSEAVRSLFRILTHRRPQCSDYATPTSSSSAGPS
ncbi:hypothetical protein Tco_0562154 [Tanacetum coccineum]